ADHDQAESEKYQAAAILSAAAAVTHAAQQVVADKPNDHDSVQPADQANVQPHVTIQDMAELMRNHALQFVAIQFTNAAARNANDRILRLITSREGIDRRVVDQEHLGHW